MKFVAVFTLFAVVLVIEAKNALTKAGKDLNIQSQALIESFVSPTNFSRYCGGVVIHPRFILTHSTCIRSATSFKVAVGNARVTENSDWFVNDCALIVGDLTVYMLELGVLIFINPINGGNVAVANLPIKGSDILANDPVYVASYGTYNVKQIVPSLNLSVAEFKGLDRKVCSTEYRPLVDDSAFCYYSEETTLCQVDYSSPVYTDENTVVGLTLYRDIEECSKSRPVISHRFGNFYFQEIIQEALLENCTKSNHYLEVKLRT